jgi:hypothetical protein
MPDDKPQPGSDEELALIQENTADGDDIPDGVVPADQVPQTADPVEGSPA